MLSFATFLKTFESFQSSKDFQTVSFVPEARKVFLNTLSTSLSSIGVPSRQVSTSGWFCAQQTRKYKKSLKSFSIIFSLFPLPDTNLFVSQPDNSTPLNRPQHWIPVFQLTGERLMSLSGKSMLMSSLPLWHLLLRHSPNNLIVCSPNFPLIN